VIFFVSLALLTAPPGETPDFTFFKAKIRPVLVSKCYACHSSKLSTPKGELQLDTRDGLRRGGATGATDEFGFKAIENRVSIHDLHATILHALGIDHTKLTYRYAGRDFRLTDVFGEVVKDILI
jgi:hypothetical protein